jgi:hypothetical protein
MQVINQICPMRIDCERKALLIHTGLNRPFFKSVDESP